MKKEGTYGVQRELEKVRIEIWRKERESRLSFCHTGTERKVSRFGDFVKGFH